MEARLFLNLRNEINYHSDLTLLVSPFSYCNYRSTPVSKTHSAFPPETFLEISSLTWIKPASLLGLCIVKAQAEPGQTFEEQN